LCVARKPEGAVGLFGGFAMSTERQTILEDTGYLGVSRPSLYRAFDKLSDEELITVIGKEVKFQKWQ